MDSEKDEVFSSVIQDFDIFKHLIKISRKINNLEFDCVLLNFKYIYIPFFCLTSFYLYICYSHEKESISLLKNFTPEKIPQTFYF